MAVALLLPLGFLLLCWPLVNSQSFPYVSLFYVGQTLANHSYVDLSLVGYDSSGSDSDTVQCITDQDTCCSSAQGVHRGDWYFPDGTRLPFPGGGDISEYRKAQSVDLRRRNTAISPVGIYRYDIPTDAVHIFHSKSVSHSLCGTVYWQWRHVPCTCHEKNRYIHHQNNWHHAWTVFSINAHIRRCPQTQCNLLYYYCGACEEWVVGNTHKEL